MDKVTRKYLLIGGLWGFGTIGAIILFRNKLSDTLKQTKAFKEVMEEVRKHKGAIQFLGEPIEDKRCEFDHKDKEDKNETHVRVDVVGPKSNGVVFFTTKPLGDNVMNIKSIHLQIGKNKSELLVIK